MTQLSDIVNLALRDSGVLGVGQTAQAQDTADALTRVQFMLAEWSRRRWLVYHLADVSTATSGAASYALGTGLLLNIARLDRIDGAYLVDGSGVQTPLRIVHSREEWERMTSATQVGPAEYAFYDSDAANPAVYLFPVTAAGYTLHVLGKVPLQQFTALSDAVTLPPEYNEAIYASLVNRLRAGYGLTASDYFVQLEQTAVKVLEQANLQPPPLRSEKVRGRSLGDLINLALEDSGAFGPERQITVQDTFDGLWRMNMTLAQWSRRRWLVYHLVDTAVAASGAASYSVGPGGAFNISRPDRIEGAYIRQTAGITPVDFPLGEYKSREEYALVALKTMQASPARMFFYDSGYPTGTLYVWPVPTGPWELHILTKEVLQQFASIEDTLALPAEYEMALYAQAVVDARDAYGLPPSPMAVGRLKAALNTLRRANFQIGKLRMPKGLRPPGPDVVTFGGGSGAINTEGGQALVIE